MGEWEGKSDTKRTRGTLKHRKYIKPTSLSERSAWTDTGAHTSLKVTVKKLKERFPGNLPGPIRYAMDADARTKWKREGYGSSICTSVCVCVCVYV